MVAPMTCLCAACAPELAPVFSATRSAGLGEIEHTKAKRAVATRWSIARRPLQGATAWPAQPLQD
ncbi:hypothetical protein BER93_12185 [Xanthomonas fragariae]|nr:hypothetical protein BER92_12160 [Xanthomonas fragariae]AOD18753.1 hypothetical protein BER93_12185 [Xanthomonas fragariae]ENZ93501.1 hypothetical protein O1K_20107 [Xanthomonas fragariae LMG 25863]